MGRAIFLKLIKWLQDDIPIPRIQVLSGLVARGQRISPERIGGSE
jgi:hypothetical protein